MLTSKQKERLYRQQFRVIGEHSAVKICFWTKECVRNKNKVCYKEHFYGIHCGNCLEMSPALTCNHRCKHCWRDNTVFSPSWRGKAEEPREIIKSCIEERKKLMIGFKGNKKVDLKQFDQYLIPDHAAISLTGEPCLYPKLPQLVDSFFDDFHFRTVFLVTNGTLPEMLKRFGTESRHFPTNIYLSMEAYDLDSYKEFNHPVARNAREIKASWDKIQESMKYLHSIKDKCRTILRITAVKNFNLNQASSFIPFIKIMQPTHIEIKGYGFLGYSRKRLKEENVPNFEEVKQFSMELAKLSGYQTTNQHQPSTIIQLSKDQELSSGD